MHTRIIAMIALILGICAQGQASTLNARSAASGAYTSYSVTLLNELPGFIAAEDAIDDFTKTGMCRYMREDSTGYYHVAKIDDRWWIVDPDGYVGINMAVTSIDNTQVQNDYDLVRKNGFNGIGNFLSAESQTKNAYNAQNYFQFSYTRRYPFHENYISHRIKQYPLPASITKKSNYLFVLDPGFESYVESQVEERIAPYVSERNLLGWFTDNELPFNQDQLRLLTADLNIDDPSRQAALAWATAHGLSDAECMNGTAPSALKDSFAIYLAETYFSVMERQIRRVDSVHMILGSRLHGRPRAIMGVVNASHAHTDVTSVNFYDKFCPDDQIAKASWTQDHPCIVGEFYIKDANFTSGTQSGAGWYVNGQADRGKWYQNTCLQLLRNKCFVGWHYFRYMDDGTSNKGMVSAARKEYTEMTQYMQAFNRQVYRLTDYLDGQNRVIIQNESSCGCYPAVADTYTKLGSTQQEIFGHETSLLVQNNIRLEHRKEIFIGFDLHAMDTLMPYVKHAEVLLTCSADNGQPHTLMLSGLNDDTWNETTLCGAVEYVNEDWKTTYNRLSSVRDTIRNNGVYRFDVTHWLQDHHPASFKLHDLERSDAAVAFYSHESDWGEPQLLLTLWGEWQLPSGIVEITPTDETTAETDYITIDGRSLGSSMPQHGLFIKRCRMKNGQYVSEKILK